MKTTKENVSSMQIEVWRMKDIETKNGAAPFRLKSSEAPPRSFTS